MYFLSGNWDYLEALLFSENIHSHTCLTHVFNTRVCEHFSDYDTSLTFLSLRKRKRVGHSVFEII